MASEKPLNCPRCPICGERLKIVDPKRGICMHGHGVFNLEDLRKG